MSDKESFASLFAETARPARRFSVGDKLDVTVTKIGKVAVFVSLDENTEGYIDLPELADKHGKLEVELGTRLHARVAEVGGRSGAVRLTPVAIRGDYDEVQALSGGGKNSNRADEPTLVVGLAVKVSVQKVEKFGVFVNIVGSKKRALLRAQDTGTRRGADLTKDFPPGKELEVKIINISDDGKIGVSITALKLDEERQNFTAHEAGEAEAAQAGGAPKGGKGKGGAAPLKPGMDGKAPKSLGTLGDLLANVKVKK